MIKEVMEKLIGSIMTEFGTTRGLATAYLIVSALVVIMAIVCAIMSVVVWFRYSRANRHGITNQMSGLDTCRFALDRSGLQHVKVIKTGFIRELFFGNYYNIYTKTVYLRSVFGKIDTKQSMTSTALALQKAGIAKLCEEGDRKAVTRNRLSIIAIFGPILFIPFVIIGFLVDFYVLKTNGGMASYIGLGVGGVLLLIGLIVTFLNIPVEKKGNEIALEMAKDYGLANEEELEIMRKVFSAYIMQYICQFILEVLRVIEWVLRVVIQFNSKKD